MKAKSRGSVGAPSVPAPRPPSAGKRARTRAEGRRGRRPARGGVRTPGAGAGRPPTAPEDFSPNWRALQELLRQKSQVPEEPPASQMGFKKPKVTQQNRKEMSDRTETAQETTRVPATSASKRNGKSPVAVTKTSGAEHKKGAKRTHGDVSPQHGGSKHKKRSREAAVASAPPAPTADDIWFDDVDPADIEAALGPEAAMLARRQLGQGERQASLVKEQAFSCLTKALALDCEMVGVGPKGEDSIVARVSVVNQYGKCVYDKYVKPTEPVTDYRTAVSGIRPENLKQGEKFEVVKQEVAEMLKGRILVGHALYHDLKVLFLDHPKKKIRDTQKYKPFKSQVKSGRPSLKQLSEKILGIKIQQAEHCSVQDAQAAMRLYTTVKRTWESTARDRRPPAAAPDACKEHA